LLYCLAAILFVITLQICYVWIFEYLGGPTLHMARVASSSVTQSYTGCMYKGYLEYNISKKEGEMPLLILGPISFTLGMGWD